MFLHLQGKFWISGTTCCTTVMLEPISDISRFTLLVSVDTVFSSGDGVCLIPLGFQQSTESPESVFLP